VARALYSDEPADTKAFQEEFDRFYTRIAPLYDLAVKLLPFWKTWLKRALPHVSGQRVLEVSFGTGYLLMQYAGRLETHGIDLNARMVSVAVKNLRRKALSADLRQGNVEDLPYQDGYFDTVVSTMAFSGYPDGAKAMSEMWRVLRSKGSLVLIDINYPADGNWVGTRLTRLWQRAGDIIRDIDGLLVARGFDYEDTEIGGFGSVHMYVCHKT
jgi:ubiquinone/menaquinone biosynthesis C-methylase UbiE